MTNKQYEDKKELLFRLIDTKKQLKKTAENIFKIECELVFIDTEQEKMLQAEREKMEGTIKVLENAIAEIRITFSAAELKELKVEYKKRALAAL